MDTMSSRVLESLKYILSTRGYTFVSTTVQENWIEVHATYIRDKQRHNMTCYIHKGHMPKCGKKDILAIDISVNNRTHSMFIVGKISVQATYFISRRHVYHEILYPDELLVPVLDHAYVPTYRIISGPELEEIKEDKTKFNKMIAKKDPIARLLDFREGDLVETVTWTNNGRQVSYRYLCRE